MEQSLRRVLLRLGSKKENLNSGERNAEYGNEEDKLVVPEALEDCFTKLQALISTKASAPSDGRNTVNELCVLCAEVAAQQRRFEISSKCVDYYFLHDPPPNQFFCRALFIRGILDFEKSQKFNGDEATKQCVVALSHIIKALRICINDENPERYSFLIYNGTITLWNIIRPLLRPGLRHLAVAGLEKSIECLETVHDSDLIWRAKLNLALALSLEEKADKSGATNRIKCAQDLINEFEENPTSETNFDVDSVKTDILRVSNHLNGQSSLASAKKEKEEGKYDSILQCIRSNFLSAAEVEKELQSMLETFGQVDEPAQDEPAVNDDADGNDSENNKIKEIKQNDITASQKKNLSTIASIGRIGIKFSLADIVSTCIDIGSRANGDAKSARFEILFDYLIAEWQVVEQERLINDATNESSTENKTGKDPRKLAAIGIAKRIDALKLLTRSIQSCARLNDVNLLEEGCILAWNVCMPLLQPHLRKYVHQALQVASNALEEADSQLTNLRAHLHTELAKCEVASDFLAKANNQVNKALSLDYGLPETGDTKENGQKSKSVESEPQAPMEKRTLDKFLIPLRKRLDLKANIYKEPDTDFEQAVIQVEQAKDSQDAHLTKTLLNRACLLLDKRSKNQPDDMNEDTKGALQQEHGQQKKFVWGEIAKLAWEKKLLAIARTAATRVIELAKRDKEQGAQEENEDSHGSNTLNDKNFAILLARTYFINAETYVHQIKTAFVHEECPRLAGMSARALGMEVPCFESDINSARVSEEDENTEAVESEIKDEEKEEANIWELEEEPFDSNLVNWKNMVIENILAGLEIGAEIFENWIVENAVVYLWNYHLHLFSGPNARFRYILPSLRSALEKAHSIIQERIQEKDSETFCNLSYAYARALEQIGDTEKSAEIAKTGINVAMTLEHSKNLLSLLQRVQRKNGVNEPLPSLQGNDDTVMNAEAYVFSAVELMLLDENLVPKQEKLELLTGAVAAFESRGSESEYKNELWTKLGRSAFDLDNLHIAELCVSNAVKKLPKTTGKHLKGNRGDVLKNIRWGSIANCLWGQIIVCKTNPITQSKSRQDVLLVDALQKFTEAARLGRIVKSPSLVLDAAKQTWNASIDYVGSGTTRLLLLEPFKEILKELVAVKENKDMELRVRLLCVIFNALKDKEDWKGGLALAESMMPLIPGNLQKPLWEARVVFTSKLGRDAAMALHNMKSSDDSLQAKSWLTLARASSNKEDQLMAYVRAVNILEGTPECSEYMIELAEWLYLNNFNYTDVFQCLCATADNILDIEPDENDDQGDELVSLGSGKSSVSQKKIHIGKSSVRTGGSSKRPKTRPGSLTSGKRSQRSLKSIKFGDDESDAGENDEISVDQHLLLVRIFTMLARISQSYTQRRGYLLIAHSHVLNAWNKIFLQLDLKWPIANGGEKEEGEQKEAEGEDTDTKDSSSKILHPFLQDPYGWTSFSMADQLRSQHDSEANNEGESKSLPIQNLKINIKGAPLILHHLLELSNMLMNNSLELFTLPALHMMHLVGTYVISPSIESIRKISLLRISNVLDLLNIPDVALQKEMEARPFTLDESIRIKHLIEVERLEQQHRDESVKQNSEECMDVQDSSNSDSLSFPVRRYRFSKIEIRRTWTLLAMEYIKVGHVQEAKVLLDEVRRHNFAFKDDSNSAMWAFAQAKLSVLNGEIDRALAYAVECNQYQRAAGGSDLEIWCQCTLLVVSCLSHLGRRNEVKDTLDKAILAVENMKYKTDLDKKIATCKLQRHLALEYLQDAKTKFKLGVAWNHLWLECDELFSKSADIFVSDDEAKERHVWESEEYLNSLIEHGNAALEMSKCCRMDSVVMKSLLKLQEAKHVCEKILIAYRPATISDSVVSFPLGRKMTDIEILLGDAELERGSILGISQESSKYTLKRDSSTQKEEKENTVVGMWLEETAPPKALQPHELMSQCEDRACMHYMSAYSNSASIESMKAKVAFTAGKGLARSGKVEHAMKLLEQAICIGKKQNQYEYVENASLEIFLTLARNQITSQHHHDLKIENLLLYQSSRTRNWLFKLVDQASSRFSKLGFFIRHHEHQLKQKLNPLFVQPSPNSAEGDDTIESENIEYVRIMNSCNDFFNNPSNSVGSSLKCEQPVADILDTHISNKPIGIFTLGFSPGKSELYSGFVAYGKKEEMEVVEESEKESDDYDAEKVCRYSSCRNVRFSKAQMDEVERLETKLLSFQRQTASYMVGYGNDYGPEGDFVLSNNNNQAKDTEEKGDEDLAGLLDVDSKEGVDSFKKGSISIVPNSDRMESELCAIVDKFIELIRDSVVGMIEESGISRLEVLSNYHLVLLCGNDFARFPLESIAETLSPSIGFNSVCRDFSIHTFDNRFVGTSEDDIDGSVNKLNYVVDPRNEENQGNLATPFRDYMSENKKSWSGIMGGESAIPGNLDWQKIIQFSDSDSSSPDRFALLYLGLSRMLSHFEPESLIGLNSRKCWLALLIDSVHTDSTLGRQNKSDNLKTSSRLDLEQPVETAAILSLIGVKTVMLQQWNNSMHANINLLSSILKSLDQDGDCIGKSLQAWREQQTESEGETELIERYTWKRRVKFNTIIYGLPHIHALQ